jgi:hypothetical protein
MRISSKRALAEELAGITGVYAVLGVVRLAGCFAYFRRKRMARSVSKAFEGMVLRP